MKTFAEAILEAETIGTRTEKYALLSNFNTDEQRLLSETYDPFRIFGVRQYDTPEVFAEVDAPYDGFFKLLDLLSDRSLTGNAARAAVTGVLSTYTKDTVEILDRVLKKDLKCGASRDTFEALYPDLEIPRFDVMLASKIEEIAEHTRESRKNKKVVLTPEILAKKYGLVFPVLAESKYDGCLSGDWVIEFQDGKSILIKDVVDNISCFVGKNVKSYNEDTQQIEFKPLIAGTKNINPDQQYEWFEIVLEDGRTLPPLTGNHRIFLPLLNCYRRVDELDGSECVLIE